MFLTKQAHVYLEPSCPPEESCLCPHRLDLQVSSKHIPFFHVYFNGFLPPFNFLFHPLEVSYTDNILSIGSNHLKNILTFIIIDVIMFTAATSHPWIKLNEIYEVLNIVFLLTILSPRNIGVSTIDQSHECEWIIWTMERQFSKINFVSTQF